MAEDNDKGQEKTHEPTERRKEDFRNRGQVPRSKDVVTSVSLALTATSLVVWAGVMGQGIAEVFHACFGRIPDPNLDPVASLDLVRHVLRGMAWSLVVPMGVAFASSLLVEAVQSQGTLNTEQPLQINWEKLNVVANFQNQFISLKPLVELGKSLIKLLAIGWLLYVAVSDRIGLLPALVHQQPEAIFLAYREMGVLVLTRAIPVALFVAALDYGYQWYEMHEKMRMTRGEIKEEVKKSEGDPHVRSARRSRMRQIATQKTLMNVSKADLVITNPTHYAVALRYRREEAPAPVIVAKGVDHLALKIRLEAARLDIPRIENRPLARGLYHYGKEGKVIPEEFYGAVARVLAVLWRRRRPAAGGSPR